MEMGMVIVGLKDADQFRKDVLEAKSKGAANTAQPAVVAAVAAPANDSINRDAAGGGKSVQEELQGLAAMFKDGLLSKEEFDSAKAKLLGA
jgi:hypothetical protein